MTTKVREKSGKKTGSKVQHDCRRIQVEDLRVNDEIGTVFGEGAYGQRVILNSMKVKDIVECPSQWRTHIHINGQGCYDTRQHVYIKVTK